MRRIWRMDHFLDLGNPRPIVPLLMVSAVAVIAVLEVFYLRKRPKLRKLESHVVYSAIGLVKNNEFGIVNQRSSSV